MRIILVTAYFPPDTGSAAHLFFELGQEFIRRGHEVHVVTGFPGYHAQGDALPYRWRFWLREHIAGMTVHRCSVPQVARNTPVGRGLWQFSCALSFSVGGLRIPRPDIALVYSPPLPLGLTAWLWRGLRGIPFVLNIQDLFPQSAIDLGILRQKHLIRLFEWIESLLCRKADAVTVHSSGNRDHVLGRGGRPDTTVVMHNSVDLAHIRPGARDNALRRELGLTGKFVASFAGVMGYSQDLDVILESARLTSHIQDMKYLLVGDGVEKPRLLAKSQKMCLTNVVWLPMVPRERYPEVLHASDVGLATLRAEVRTPVVPSKILSVMAAGIPVVAAMNLDGDAPKLIAEAQCGYCLEAEHSTELAETLLRLYGNRGLCAVLGANGRRYAETHLNPQAVAASYTQLFAKVGK